MQIQRARGEILRNWVRDENGLLEITATEYQKHRKKAKGRWYPFIVISFHIYQDRKKVSYIVIALVLDRYVDIG